MMKKLSAILLAATLTLTIGTTAAFAAGHGSHIHYVDANQDNICDYCDQNRLCADEDHDGICDYLSVSARQEPVLTVRVPDITETITREIIRTVKTVPAVITQDTTDK
mgnify:CR=1 FL=1